MRPLTDVEAPNMLGLIATDMRSVFGSKTMHNFVETHMMDYDTQTMDRLDDDMKCTVLRTKPDLMLDKNSSIALLKRSISNMTGNYALPYAERKRLLLESLAHITGKGATTVAAFLSYIGKIDLPEAVFAQVEDIQLTLPSITRATLVECFDFNGKMIFNTFCGLNTLAPLEHIRDSLIAMGIPCILEEPQPIPESRYESDCL